MTEHSPARPQVTAVIPTFNEEGTIARVISEAKRYVDEVVVIDDGSCDGTRQVALKEGAVVLSHPRNLGYGSALASGFSYVRDNGGGIMVVIDGDGQHNPADIPRLIGPIVDGDADLVTGSRFLDSHSRLAVPVYRRIGILVVNRMWSLAMGSSVRDTQCGYRAYSRGALCNIEIRETNMSASLEILDEAVRKKLRIVEIPVNVSYMGTTGTIRPFRHGAELVNYVLRRMKDKGCIAAGRTIVANIEKSLRTRLHNGL